MKATTNNRNDLTTGVVWKKLLVFFLPIAAGTCIQQLYNAVDGLIVGRFVGTTALAAVGGSAAQIINVIIGFFVALTSGAAVIIAQMFGAGRLEDVHRASGSAVTLCAVLGIFLGAAGFFAAPKMLTLLQTPENTMQESLTYLRIYFVGVPFVLILNMESNMMRSVGESFAPFIFMVVCCVSNIIMDFVFVVCFHWAVAGVAIATVLAQVINTALLTWKLLTADKAYRIAVRDFKITGQYLRGMLRIGIPAGLQSSMYSVSNTVIQVGVNTLGTVVVASWAMTSKTDGIYWAVSGALGTAITSFIGQNFGAGKMDRVKKCVKEGIILSLIITVTLSTLIMVLAKPLLRILTKDTAVISTTFEIMWYFVPYYFTWTLIEVISAVLRGSGDATRPVIIIGLGICLFRVLWIVTVFRHFHTLTILSLSYVTSWVITSIALLIYYLRGGWIKRTQRTAISHE